MVSEFGFIVKEKLHWPFACIVHSISQQSETKDKYKRPRKEHEE